MATTTKKSGTTTTKKATKPTTIGTVKTVDNSEAIAALQKQVEAVIAQNATLKEQNETFKAQNEAFQAQNEMLMKMLSEMRSATPQPIPATFSVPENALNKTVTLVHLMERAPGLTTYIKLSNRTINFHTFGEEVTLDLRQAEELAGDYRKYFERGFIAFGAGFEDLAHSFGLKTVKDYSYYSKDFVNQLGTLTTEQLENLYNKVAQGHKDLIIQHFKRKIIEGDPAFKNRYKVEMLNRVSDGAMSNVLLDFKLEEEQKAAKNAKNN